MQWLHALWQNVYQKTEHDFKYAIFFTADKQKD